MALIKKTEKTPERPVIIVIYGTSGAGKTSLFNTSNNPVLVDCDRGFDRAVFRQDTISASSWEEVLRDEAQIRGYSTVGIDTAKAALDDYLMLYVQRQDYKLKTNTLKAYGKIGEEFKAFINRRREENIDIVIIAHAKEEKDGDTTKISPDVTGQSKDLILRIADQVGYVCMSNNRRTIQFDPTDRTVGKNVAALPTMEIPDRNDPRFATFMADIIAKVKESITAQSESQRIAIETTTAIQEDIASLSGDEPAAANAIIETIIENEATLGGMQTKLLKKSLLDKCASLGIEYDKVLKTFVRAEKAEEQCTTQE